MQQSTQTCENRNEKTRSLALTALFIALTFACTYICIPGPRGGFVHFGNVPFFIGCILLGAKRGSIAGAFGMALYDLAGGFFIWAPFTFVIRLAMGIIVGKMTAKTEGRNIAKNALAILIASLVMIGGYYVAEIIIYGNPAAPVLSIPGNIAQLAIGAALTLPLMPALKKAFGKKIV